jgi:hypothetical protein
MPLTRDQLEAAVREHVRAEAAYDQPGLRATLHEDVEYRIKAPVYPDDPTPYGHFSGAETYLAMWDRLHEIFERYDLELEHLSVVPETNQAWIVTRAEAVPRAGWFDLPAGKPMHWWAAAICDFDDNGHMTRETVYGSLPPQLAGWDRMKAFVAGEAGETGNG